MPTGATAQSADVPVLVIDLAGDAKSASAVVARVTAANGFAVESDTRHLKRPGDSRPGSPEVALVFDRGAGPATVGNAMRALGVRVAVVIRSARQAQIWTREDGSRFARLAASAPATDPAYVTRQVVALAPLLRAKTEQFPLLREGNVAKDKPADKPMTWWMYATVGVAVAVGATLIIAAEVDEPRQRIQVVFP